MAVSPIRVLVADDEPFQRDFLSSLVRGEPSLELVAAACDADEAVELAAVHRPDVAVLDVDMPGGGGAKATQRMQLSSPGTRVMAFSAHQDRGRVLDLIRAGAVGYLVKGSPAGEILTTIAECARGRGGLSSAVAADVVEVLAHHLEREEHDGEARRRTEEARRSTEEMFGQMAESIHEAFWMSTPDHDEVVYVSPAYERIWGRSCESLLADPQTFVEAVHPEDRAHVAAAIARLRHEEYNLEYRIVHPDGSVRWVRDRAFHVRDEQGEVCRITGIATDVTERRRTRDERDAMEFDLRVAQKLEAVGQLASGIAHEINTPMQFVGDSIHFLQDCFAELWLVLDAHRAASATGADPTLLDAALRCESDVDLEYLRERVPAAFERTFDGISRVSSIVRAMKAFAHSGVEEQRPGDLNEAIENTLTVARNEYKYIADVELDLGALPPVVCNLSDLNQVFLNLVVNAAHAIADLGAGDDEARGVIRIATRVEGSDVVVTVGDTGCGIPEEIRTRVFDPFFTTKEVGRGSGQGLALARSLVVDKHGGSLAFESEPGRGTTFEIRLPLEGKTPPAERAA